VRGIALKIFLSFWLIFAVLIATFALMPDRGVGVRFADHLRQHGSVAAQLLADRGRQSCAEYTGAVASRTGIQFALIDSERTLLCPEALAPQLAELLRRGTAGDAADDGAMLPVDMSVGRNVSVVGVPLPRFTVNLPPPPFPYRAVAFAIVISGLVCFAMARYLARPLQLVRDTSYRLAAGDLQARAGPIVGRRRDEIGDLVRDFDAMAVRIEALVHAQHQLLSDISHELRSPLARLHVALELARRKMPEDARADLDRMELEAERMNDLIGRVLSLARAENNQRAAQTPVDLAPAIASVTADAEYEAHRQHKSVALEVIGGSTVQGDLALLTSAVDNVVRNAIRYTPEHSAVDVVLDRSERQAVLTVRDRGPGVPAHELERIFSPFHRVESARGPETGGVGLGLAIARRTIEVHGGTIVAENARDGGLLVTIRLPLQRTPP
jgi:two-component system sensor histidine kinase CpxA